MAVDYGGAVSNGTVIKESEYAEMREFAQTAHKRLADLPATAGKDALLAHIELLGVYPTGETLLAQLAVGAIALASFWASTRSRASSVSPLPRA